MIDKIYFIFYCSVRMKGFAHAERASFFLAIPTFLIFNSIYFLITVFFNIKVLDKFIYVALIASFAFIIPYFLSKYFVGSGRYRRIIAKYGSPREVPPKTRIKYIIFSWSIYFGAFVLFIVSGRILSDFLN